MENKVAVITGAASGIGRATTLTFARAGAKVCAADIDAAGLETLCLEVQDFGGQICVKKTDVTSAQECEVLMAAAVSAFGRLDVLFANAGIAGQRAFAGNISTDSWQRVINVNLNGVFYCNRAAIGVMKTCGGGVIINNASVDGLVGMGCLAHYTAAKHGVVGLTKSVALDHGADQIRCVSISPGYVSTAMTDTAFSDQEREAIITSAALGKAAEPAEVGELVLWLASSKASYMTGSNFVIDGGLLAGFRLTEA